MPTQTLHRGVAANDPRNRGAIAFFRPPKVTPERARNMLRRAAQRTLTSAIEGRVRETSARIKNGPVKPPAPLDQSLTEVADPFYGLGTHPDIVERMWALDTGLPRSCRRAFWGRPALVHPDTGVVFAVGFGTIGYVMRLPPQILKDASSEAANARASGNPGQSFDISQAGPEWRFISSAAPEGEWCRAAFDFAGQAPEVSTAYDET
jgi:hypothetical protein